MWYNELLFVLMITALIGMGVMALIVKVNMSQRRNSIKKKEEIPEKILVEEKKVRYEPIQKVSASEPGPIETIESEPIKQIIVPTIDKVLIPSAAVEPVVSPKLDLPTEHAREPQSESIDQLIKMFPMDQPPEAHIPQPEPKPIEIIYQPPEAHIPQPEPNPSEGALRNTENQFFDLRYEYKQQTIDDVPTIPDDELNIGYGEEQKEENLPGVVTCQHCKCEVPNTLYCIYCGNPLTAKPLASEK